MKYIWLLLLLLISGQIFASDDIHFNTPKKLLVINPVESEITLSDIDKRLINKIVLKACAKQTEFQIAIGEIGISRDAVMHIFQVGLTISGSEHDFKITGILMDEKNKILINKIDKDKNERLHIMRNIEAVMESLFIKTPAQSLK